MAVRPRPQPATPLADRPALRAALWLGPPLLLGAALRVRGLGRQIFVGDELHGLIAALELPLGEILTVFRPADHCMPLTALFRVAVVGGVPLSEVFLRLPSALAGLGALLLFPILWVRAGASSTELSGAAAFGWLLAVSPSLVFYSRIARPYAVVALLAPVAAAAFWRWWRGGGHAWAGLYAVSAAASAWFHLGTAPFVAAPIAYGAGELLWRRLAGAGSEGRRSAPALAGAAAALAVGLAAFVVPARRSLSWLIESKSVQDATDLAGLGEVLRLQAGAPYALLVALFWGLAGLGLVALLRRRSSLGLYALTLVAVQWMAITLVLRPEGIHIPLILNRYLVAGLPVVLFWAARGLQALAEGTRGWRGRLPRGAGAGAAILALAGLVVTSPYVADSGLRLGSFGGTHPVLGPERELPRLPASAVPTVYPALAAEPGGEAVLELVRSPRSYLLGPILALARVHGRPVVLATREAWAADPRLDLRTVVPVDPERIERTGARFVVLHRDPFWLGKLLLAERAEGGGPDPEPTPLDRPAVTLARRLARELCAAWGEPTLTSDGVLVWDLARPDPRAAGAVGRGAPRCPPESWHPAGPPKRDGAG
jgi:hypothetical protein